MPNDNVNARRFESPAANDPARGAADQMMQLVHDLRYQCPDGSLVTKPVDCGASGMSSELSKILPPLQIG